MTGHLRLMLGPLPCRSCGATVTVYRVWYGRWAMPLCVTHDDDGLHKCHTMHGESAVGGRTIKA